MSDTNIYELKLTNKIQVQNRYTIFEFERPENFSFLPGQYGVFAHIDKTVEGRKVRPFSLAMAKDDNLIRVATRIEPPVSHFKQLLDGLNMGEQLKMQGPMGTFGIVDQTDAVFLVGGIGITPILSMALSNPVLKKTLVYSELNKIYLFKDTLEDISNLEIIYTSGIEPTKNNIEKVVTNKPHANFYIVGSPGFVKGMKELLSDLKVPKAQVYNDSFTGY
ncbi:MAG: FAD-dependent oxidoreductase [Candidatus Izimaplasma sp.]|nr:FAD-dependent oxidoreductase [Candidatus Izimaplasma bacterium]